MFQKIDFSVTKHDTATHVFLAVYLMSECLINPFLSVLTPSHRFSVFDMCENYMKLLLNSVYLFNYFNKLAQVWAACSCALNTRSSTKASDLAVTLLADRATSNLNKQVWLPD